ncbi:ferredoxin [Streptomyces rimosus]|uniref:ferredoxin n=1 Tax=Streptomyces rimosus TaxID=1927 RepID=UPI0004C806E2|nr:(4Fe-4S)-binding protein [Streptomyces rimosus]
MHVTADRDVCVGAGMCALTAPGVFDQDDDGLVTVLTSGIAEDSRDAVREAGMLCPSGALRVTE